MTDMLSITMIGDSADRIFLILFSPSLLIAMFNHPQTALLNHRAANSETSNIRNDLIAINIPYIIKIAYN